jgi:hypothetical protein
VKGTKVNLTDANKAGLTIFYTRDDKSTRHICLNGRETLCGKMPYEGVTLALPVNCDECRTQTGKSQRNDSKGTK